MKTIFTALVVMATTISASANHTDKAAGPVKNNDKVLAVMPVSKSSEQKMAELSMATEDKISRLNFTRVMQNTLNQVESLKHRNAMENLEAENAYNQLMANTLAKVEQEKLADQLEDITAEQRFEQLMGQIIQKTAAR